MNVFIFEHICGGACDEEVPAALADAGFAMWRAVTEDFAAAGNDVRTTVGTRQDFQRDGTAMSRITRVNSLDELVGTMARQSDAALIIAPETGAASLAWARKLAAWGVPSLGCAPEAIELCGDKFALFQNLANRGIPIPRTDCGDAAGLLDAASLQLGSGRSWILKPRDGAGCEQTYFIRGESDLVALQEKLGQRDGIDAMGRSEVANETPRHGNAWALGDWILQPYCRGRAVSASFIVHADRVIPLRAGAQRIEVAAELRYIGGELPLPDALAERAMQLAERAVRFVPGLRGFVGVDLVLGESAEHDVVIEINPRVTMSYCGLRRLSKANLAAMMLDASLEPSWCEHRVRFDNTGRVEEY